MNTKKKSFALGYSLIIHSILTYFIFAGLTTSGLNVLIPTFSNMYGWDRSLLMTLSTVGGLLAVAGSLIFSQLIMSRGARLISVITLILTGLAIILLGNASSIAVYFICVALFHLLAQGYCNIGTNTIIGNWYPVRKGFVLGITTAGMPMASVAFVPLLNATFGSIGPMMSLTIIGATTIAFGIISWFWIRDTPQEVGLQPDNGKYPGKVQELPGGKSRWTFAALMKNKNAFLIAVGYGLLFIVTQGMVSQLVPYLMEQGFAQPNAVATLSMGAVIGIVGSFLWGVVDDRAGTKEASVLYCIWYIISFVILLFPINSTVLMIGIVMFGAGIGGIGNLMPSMIITAFGPAEFASASRVVNTVCSLVRAFSFLAIAIGLKINGTYRMAVLPLIIISFIALIMILYIDKKDAPQIIRDEKKDTLEA